MLIVTGQKPAITVAKKSIAGFKLREGQPREELNESSPEGLMKRIVKHLWIMFVLLPFVAAVVLIVAGVIR